jgi:hypothetical protein
MSGFTGAKSETFKNEFANRSISDRFTGMSAHADGPTYMRLFKP